jgi:hypothetical protein
MSAITTTLTSRKRLIGVVTAAITAAAIAPAAASASTTWFGSSLDHTPANAGSSCSDDGVGPSDICTHVGSDYPGFSGHAQSPVNGTIVALKIRPAGPMTFTFQVVKVRDLSSSFGSGQAEAVQRSRKITLQGPTQDQMADSDYPVDRVPVHLNVRKGQYLAIDTSSNQAEYCSDGTPGQLLFDPNLSPSEGFQPSAGVDDCLMLVQAVVQH